MEFRTIPSRPDYEVSLCGVVRRRERPSKMIDKPPIAARNLNRVPGRINHVSIGSKQIMWQTLRDEAWGCETVIKPRSGKRSVIIEDQEFDAFDPWRYGRPVPIAGGRVITLSELIAERRAQENGVKD